MNPNFDKLSAPQKIFCPNISCLARGQTGKGNIHFHSQKDKLLICDVCQDTFTTSKGTIFYRLRHDPKTVLCVIILLAYGCPLQAIVKAFERDERTVRAWHERAGKHCQNIHEQIVEKSQQDLQQVQADEIKVTPALAGGARETLMGSYWMALAIAVSTRLWLGSVVSRKRDLDLIQSLVDKVRAIALCRPLLLAADGLAIYVTAFRMAFRSKVPQWRGEIGRCKMVSWPNIAIVQVVKQRAEGVLTVDRRIVQGSQEMVERLRKATQNGKGVTPYLRWVQVSIRLSSNGSTPPFACV